MQDFEATLRGHLSNLTRKWKDKIDRQSIENKSISAELSTELVLDSETELLNDSVSEAIEQIHSEDDYGFFDYIEIYNSEFLLMNDALEGITKATTNIGQKVEKHGSSLKLVNEINDQAKKFSRIKKLFNLVSSDLNNYSNSLDKNIKILANSRGIAFDALGKSLILYAESYPDENKQLEIVENQLKELIAALSEPYISMTGFRNAVDSLPKFTNLFNKSKRATTISLDKFITEIDDLENTATNILNSIIELKGRNIR